MRCDPRSVVQVCGIAGIPRTSPDDSIRGSRPVSGQRGTAGGRDEHTTENIR